MAENTSGESIARSLIDLQNAHRVDAVLALFAPDAVVTLPTGVDDTPEKIRAWQQGLADGNFHIWENPIKVNGNKVNWTGEVALDMFRHMGLERLGGIWALVIEGGKIKTFNFTFTPEAFAALQAGRPPA
jgi:hypothetical protein